MGYQENDRLPKGNPEQESAQVLLTHFKNELTNNLRAVGLSPTDVRSVNIIPIVPTKAAADFLTDYKIDAQTKLIIVSLTDRKVPQAKAIKFDVESLRYAELLLEMYEQGFGDDLYFSLKLPDGENERQAYIDYKESVIRHFRFTQRADIPFGSSIEQHEAKTGKEELLVFFWNPEQKQKIVRSIVMPIGWEEQLKISGIMDNQGVISKEKLAFGDTKPKDLTVRPAAEIRARLEAKYSWILPHYIRYKSPEPDPTTQPKEHEQWEKSTKIVKSVLELEEMDTLLLDDSDGFTTGEADALLGEDDSYKVEKILDRLTTPIVDRLNTIVDMREKTLWVENPTNAKQTLRAIRQIDEQLALKIPKDPDYYDLELDELTAVKEAGYGYSAEGVLHFLTGEELEGIDLRILEINADAYLFTGKERKQLVVKRRQYLSELPPHIRKQYDAQLKQLKQ